MTFFAKLRPIMKVKLTYLFGGGASVSKGSASASTHWTAVRVDFVALAGEISLFPPFLCLLFLTFNYFTLAGSHNDVVI